MCRPPSVLGCLAAIAALTACNNTIYENEQEKVDATSAPLVPTYSVPFLAQGRYAGIGASASAPTSITMLLRYLYPNSNIDVPEVYHSGMQAYRYDGPALGYRNLSWAGTNPGNSAIPPGFASYYDALGNSGNLGYAAIANYLSNVWDLSVAPSILSIDAFYDAIAAGPVLVHVWGHGNADWDSYVLAVGLDDKGTLSRDDDVVRVHDPYGRWGSWDTTTVTGQLRPVSYEAFFVRGLYGSAWFRDAIAATTSATATRRRNTVVVDSGHSYVNGNHSVHLFQLDDANDRVGSTSAYAWSQYYGPKGDWFYPNEAGHRARWTPRLPTTGRYQVAVKFVGDPTSGNVTYTVHDASGAALATRVVNQYRSTSTSTSETIAADVVLKPGAYVRATDIAVKSSIDAVKFSYLGAASYPPASGDVSLGLGTPVSASVAAGASRRYTFPRVAGRSYEVTLTPTSGDPDLYISGVSTISTAAYDCKSDRDVGVTDRCAFTAADSGTSYILVTGYSSASYTVRVDEFDGRSIQPTINVAAPEAFVTVYKPKAALAVANGAQTFEWTIEGGQFTDAAGNHGSATATGASVYFQASFPGQLKMTCVATTSMGQSKPSVLTVEAIVPPRVELSASPELVLGGGSTTLRAVFDADATAQVVGLGPITSGGALAVTPSVDTDYTVEVKNRAGEAVTASVRIVVLPPTTELNFMRLSPPTFSLESKLTVASDATIGHWVSRPAAVATYGYPIHPTLSSLDRESIAALKGGRFRPKELYPWIDSPIPPRWQDDPAFDQTYAFYKHSLMWTVPLVSAWVVDGDEDALALFKSIVTDWITKASASPFPAHQAWVDHPTSFRARIFTWFWALWEKQAASDPAFANLVLRSIHQHATYLSALDNYFARTNHAVHMDGSLLAVATAFPEFRDSDRWMAVAQSRLAGYGIRAFSAAGFNLEQSPYYHWYALGELGESTAFMVNNGIAPPAAIRGVLERGIAVYPYLLRPDSKYPNVGDSAGGAASNWRSVAEAWLGSPPPPTAPGLPSPRSDAGPFIVDSDSGYAIFSPNSPSSASPNDDTYLAARINSKPFSAHCQQDAGTFELFALGRDWLVDSGKYSYDMLDPARVYVRSSRAHNVVIVDDENFQFNPVRLLAAKRTQEGDSVTIRHELPKAYHDRTLELASTRALHIADRMTTRDEQPHLYTQLFQVAPGLTVELLTPQLAHLIAPDGSSAMIVQKGAQGVWTTTTGQETPYFQGWYSILHGKRVPITTLAYATPVKVTTWDFDTEVTVSRPTH